MTIKSQNQLDRNVLALNPFSNCCFFVIFFSVVNSDRQLIYIEKTQQLLKADSLTDVTVDSQK